MNQGYIFNYYFTLNLLNSLKTKHKLDNWILEAFYTLGNTTIPGMTRLEYISLDFVGVE